MALSKAAPGLSFVVQDLPDVVAEGQEDLPADMKGKIQFQAHDFWKPQPVQDVNIFLLRMILRDHPDHLAVTILKNLIPAMENGAKLIVQDGVVLESNSSPFGDDRVIR